jgi:hypothetical protein
MSTNRCHDPALHPKSYPLSAFILRAARTLSNAAYPFILPTMKSLTLISNIAGFFDCPAM